MAHSRIEQIFSKLKLQKQRAVMPYFMAGYPTFDGSKEAILAAVRAGADLIELGIPFSDPLADGPVIQEAAKVALGNGTTTEGVFELARSIADECKVPIVLMTYYNPVYRYGLEGFAKRAAESGVSGLIVPDLPPEESDPLRKAARSQGIDTIFLVAPTSTPKRIAAAAEASTGFVYCVSITGVTGERAQLPANLVDFVEGVRSIADKPVAVGFGISNAEQARQVAEIADGVIIGSALVRLIGQSGPDAPERIASFIATIKDARK